MPEAGRADPTRHALLRAAHDLLAADGPTALTVRAIATQAGVSTMNVYSRFGGKDGVLDELYVDGFSRLAEAMAAVAETDDPRADLYECGQAYRAFARSAPTYYSLMFDRVVPEYVPSLAARTVAYATFQQLVAKVARAMDAGVVAGGDAETVAGGLWALVHGLASLEAITVLDHQHGGTAPFEWASIAEGALRSHVDGLGRRPAGTTAP